MLRMLPNSIKHRLGVIRERLLRPDAYVVSYPKSGRTWLQMILARIYERETGLPLNELLQQLHRDVVRQSDGTSIPTVRFGHGYRYKYFCQSDPFPSWFYRGARVVLLVRDPRDILVSYYYWQKYNFHSFDGTLHEFVHTCGDDRHPEDHRARCGIKPILKYYNTWLAHAAEFSDLLVLHYEDLKTDSAANLRSMLEFIGLNVADEVVDEAIQFASFENMRRMETAGELTWNAMPGGHDVKGFKTRKALVGGYRDELDPDDLKMIDEYLQTHLRPEFSCYLPHPDVTTRAA